MVPKTGQFFRGFFVFLFLVGIFPMVAAWVPPSDPPAHVVYFKSDTCPYCIQQQVFLDRVQKNYPQLRILTIDVNREAQLWQEYRVRNNVGNAGIPRTVIGDLTFIGFAAEVGELEYLEAYQAHFGFENQLFAAIQGELGVSDPSLAQSSDFDSVGVTGSLLYWLGMALFFLVYGSSYFWAGFQRRPVQQRRLWFVGLGGFLLLVGFLTLFLTPVSTIRSMTSGLPFPLFVAVIALVDGFNPCAFTVLAILLSLLTHTKSRRDMMVVGGIFILASGLVYFGFIMIMVLAGSVAIGRFGSIILLILGLVITLAGIIHIKDFLWFKAGPSLSISPKHQKMIHSRARKIVNQLQEGRLSRSKMAAAIGGTVVLALFVNLVELGCTAMLPAVYMATLVNRYSGFGAYALWTGLYALVYILPLGVILGGFVVTFSSARLSEVQGRYLKLAAGVFLVFFGVIMIFRPDLVALG